MSKTQQTMTLSKTLSKVKRFLYEGLKNEDWSKVYNATNLMFGNNVEVPDDDEVESLHELKAEVEALRTRIENIEGLFKSTPPSAISPYESVISPLSERPIKSEDAYDFTVKKKKEVETQKTTNKFESINISNNEIEDDLSSINDSVERVPRNRRPFTLVDVICVNCNKKLQVKSVLARENYVCDRCISRRIG